MPAQLSALRADITTLAVDAIVNAANSSLLGGGGVDGAIHDAAGPELFKACAALNGCATGDAKVTRGFRLAALWVIHTVGPIWRGGVHGEPELLAMCYRRSLEEAVRIGARSLAIPAISTGAFGFPVPVAAQTATSAVFEFVSRLAQPEQVLLVCFDSTTRHAFASAWAAALSSPPPN